MSVRARTKPACIASRCRENLRLYRLVLGVRNEPVLEELLGLLQAPCGIGHCARPRIGCNPNDTGRQLYSTGPSAQLFEIADSPLFTPRLILGLAHSIDRFSLGLAQPANFNPSMVRCAFRGQVARLATPYTNRGAKQAYVQSDFFQILPAKIGQIKTDNELAGDV